MTAKRLTKQGYELRERIAEAGFEITPDELADSLEEANERIRPGPDGCCVKCGNTHRTRGPHNGEPLDFRFGLCDECVFCAEEECSGSLEANSPFCKDHQ